MTEKDRAEKIINLDTELSVAAAQQIYSTILEQKTYKLNI